MREIRLAEKDKYIAELERRVEELKKQAIANPPPSPPLPSFVKPRSATAAWEKAGRKIGHDAALRPMPAKIDHHQQVPLPTDFLTGGCPYCKCPLSHVAGVDASWRIWFPRRGDDLLSHPQRILPTLPQADRKQARRATPGGECSPGQLGINALATAAILRVRHRLPFRQIVQLLKDMPQLSLSAGGLVKPIRRLSRWLDGKYQELILQMRASEHVHVDETGWRIDGKNFWLWAFTDPTFTLFHVDESRGGKVPLKLLGQAFGGTSSPTSIPAYDRLKARKQRCLTHLMREVKETGEKSRDLPTRRWHRASEVVQGGAVSKKRWEEFTDPQYEMKASRLEDRLDAIVKLKSEHPMHSGCEAAGRYRPELTRFLWDQKLDGTNNAAERALRRR